jgi:hypothetical protein
MYVFVKHFGTVSWSEERQKMREMSALYLISAQVTSLLPKFETKKACSGAMYVWYHVNGPGDCELHIFLHSFSQIPINSWTGEEL